MTKHVMKCLLLLAMLVSLVGCYLTPSYAYGDLFVLTSYTSDSGYGGELGACKGETLTVRWRLGEGRNPKLLASPAQNIEPQLPSRVANSGEVQLTFKDDVTISFTIDGGEDYQTERRVVAIPEGVCTGFPLELRGNYSGTLEQTIPQTASLPHHLTVRWDRETLIATLARVSGQSLVLVAEMSCLPFDVEDKLTCRYDPPGDAFLRLEGSITPTGYEGSYQGVLEGATFQTSTSGTFEFVKQ